jgi:membrane fusion protein (multidrug efflux system)
LNSVFQREALEHHARGNVEGSLLHVDPRWLTIAVRLIAVAAFVGIVFSLLFTVDEYAGGPAVVRIDGRRVVSSTIAGPVESLEVQAGQRVEVGDVLIRMRATEETAELTRASSEYDLQLVRYLVDPHDTTAKQDVSTLRARRDAAKNALETKIVRATIAGTVSDVRVKAGQPVASGEVLCAIVPPDATQLSVVALVPAEYRPMMTPGLDMRFELDGFRYEYADVRVEEVSTEAVGPAEVNRLLGTDRDGSLKLDPGGKVFVTGKLSAQTFTSEGERYRYYDGLSGTAQVRVRREPILVALVPALRRIFP